MKKVYNLRGRPIWLSVVWLQTPLSPITISYAYCRLASYHFHSSITSYRRDSCERNEYLNSFEIVPFLNNCNQVVKVINI